ncbi:Carboxylate-amine ligase YbdK [Thalassovita gelatinovora]|uniref:Putative glutamate--cysteine ligase 2 n=1 Tax=Thalassovita gelatinovora TaxID=53501 RepID=A0A0N7LU57_THAGE|nr:carboxylate-amine ligase [Thalassovita gelatinovora]QIZ79322.1 carboxylate-amine ligase [Thalassovita gelatinovora]CUH62570.1 Carboxylate-amine ligase YbdK [Thalassovita gelatinovora]SEQ06669.1 carboxylate-amine ligase [Thalassovita gelatinovora]
MSIPKPDFTIGVEEEYLLVDLDTLDLAPAPVELMTRCSAELEGQFSPEFLECQVEIGSRVCANVAEARDDLKRLRSTVARVAKDYNLAPIAASCHPFSDWRNQHHTDKERYNHLRDDLAGVVRRMLICGMHVHVGIAYEDQRIDLMNQLKYFLPHLLALSSSSPFWQGEDTGLSCYRLTVFDNLPRTGLPPQFDSWSSFDRSVHALVDMGLIDDASKIWWDLRPSSRFPTIEARICDVSPRLETTLTLAALIQSLTRMLWRLSQKNQRWRIYDNFLLAENRWRAQRYGVESGLIDYGAHEIVPFDTLVEELITLVAEDAAALNCTAEVENARLILNRGTAAQVQRQIYQDAIHAEDTKQDALKRVVKHLIEEYHADL